MDAVNLVQAFLSVVGGGWPAWIAVGLVAVFFLFIGLKLRQYRNEQVRKDQERERLDAETLVRAEAERARRELKKIEDDLNHWHS